MPALSEVPLEVPADTVFEQPYSAEIADLRAKHGELYELCAGVVVVLCRHPPRGEFRRFMQSAARGAEHVVDAQEVLFRSCVVWPEPAALEAALSSKPGYSIQFGRQLVALCGLDEEVRVRKL